MRLRDLSAGAVTALLIAGCTSMNVPFTGETHADETLRGDTLKTIRMLVKGMGCDSIDHVDSKVLAYEPSNGKAGHVLGREGWMITGCSRPFPFYVTFTEDGVGGTFFSVTPR